MVDRLGIPKRLMKDADSLFWVRAERAVGDFEPVKVEQDEANKFQFVRDGVLHSGDLVLVKIKQPKKKKGIFKKLFT